MCLRAGSLTKPPKVFCADFSPIFVIIFPHSTYRAQDLRLDLICIDPTCGLRSGAQSNGPANVSDQQWWRISLSLRQFRKRVTWRPHHPPHSVDLLLIFHTLVRMLGNLLKMPSAYFRSPTRKDTDSNPKTTSLFRVFATYTEGSIMRHSTAVASLVDVCGLPRAIFFFFCGRKFTRLFLTSFPVWTPPCPLYWRFPSPVVRGLMSLYMY